MNTFAGELDEVRVVALPEQGAANGVLDPAGVSLSQHARRTDRQLAFSIPFPKREVFALPRQPFVARQQLALRLRPIARAAQLQEQIMQGQSEAFARLF